MRYVLWALGTFLVLGCAAFLAVDLWVSAAYRFADGYPLTSVSGKNDFGKLGTTSIAFIAGGLLLVALVAFIVTSLLLIGSRTRRFGWIAPLAAVPVVAIILAIATTMFQAPPPDVGG